MLMFWRMYFRTPMAMWISYSVVGYHISIPSMVGPDTTITIIGLLRIGPGVRVGAGRGVHHGPGRGTGVHHGDGDLHGPGGRPGRGDRAGVGVPVGGDLITENTGLMDGFRIGPEAIGLPIPVRGEIIAARECQQGIVMDQL